MMPSSAAALSTLSDFNSKRQSAQDIYKGANDQYDVGGGVQRVSSLKGLVGNLQSSLEAVDPSVTGRTTGNFTTEGQRSALVNREQQPILGNLSKTQANLGTEQSNLSTSQGLAAQMASAMIAQDQTKYQSLLDQYNAATAAEQAAEQKRQWQAQFDAQQAAAAEALRQSKASGAGSYNLGAGAAKAAAPTMQPRSDGGFNFQDAAGKAISAAKFAQLTGQDVASVLRYMASKGDETARNAYVGLSKVANAKARENVIRQYSSLFWGT